MPGRLIEIKEDLSSPIAAGVSAVTVRSRAVQVTLPRGLGGFVWNRPISVHVQAPDGGERILQVHDETRLAQIVLVAAGIMFGLLLAFFASRRP